jgi:hypothetical protein
MTWLFLTLSRSGHHAIIEWVIRNCPGYVTFNNNCSLGWKEHKFLSKRPAEFLQAAQYQFNYSHHIKSIEEFYPEQYSIYDFDKFETAISKHIFVIRDSANWIASLMRGGGQGAENLTKRHINDVGDMVPSLVKQWKLQVKECLGETNFVPNKIDIYFNRWYESHEYRVKILEKLGLKPVRVDDTLLVSKAGGGSSFQPGETLGDKLDVLNRWKHYYANPEYQKIFTDDPELEELTWKYCVEKHEHAAQKSENT